ncbi:betaine/proline/choline family ABC transporter ATP-binding protein [Aquamicrobium sp. LC103]|uniref:quaternary amine ABC transporter ATP-binding protein n=1 Tax=Aquamicrobium sp. LC103 TaxID=1120658 RepID=UPI00063E7AB3|nr:betaine/proline/choline family ABC transporter ATP-binding protein [Aquamicrobium sp. LC103]
MDGTRGDGHASAEVTSVPRRIEVRGLSKVFGADVAQALSLRRQGLSKSEIIERIGAVVAVDEVSFSVDAGEIFVVMGLSGSGKSTLVRCLNRLQEPTAGRIEIDGEDIVAATEERLRALRLEKITMVFQHFALLPHRTVAENVEYGLKMRGLAKAERRAKALKTLESVGLASWADRHPADLSGGMQQRVGLARALALDPEILLMDEPFSALDPLIRRDMQAELLELQRRYRTTIIFITHDLNEALTLGHQVAVMKDGRFAQVGRPADIVLNPADDYVAAFTRDIDRGRALPVRAAIRQPGSAGAGAVLPEGAVSIEGGQPLHEVFALASGPAPVVVVDAEGRVEGTISAADVTALLAGNPQQGRS